ncbi:DND1 protein, partial [Penelope pileata]|nr:DND1 protein [Penelope pileata]
LHPQQWSSGINQANKMALLSWVRETGIRLVQVNGQRRYGGPPPGWVGSPPPAGSEVFIGKLPQDVYEDTLIPLFQSVGTLYEFRLMLTFSGLNRGFAYAKYSSQRGAREAIAALNQRELREGCAILVCRSMEKHELSVDGLPAAATRRDVVAALLEATEGLLRVTLHASPSHRRAQVAVLTYSSHHAAAMAKKTLVEGNVELFRQKVKVEWLKPELKEKLQSCREKLSPGTVQRRDDLGSPEPLGSPERVLLSPEQSLELHSALGCLGALCQQWDLGTPRFLTRCVQARPGGWLHYWAQVVIPARPAPCGLSLWVRGDAPGSAGHQEAKEAVARLALAMLGE